MRFCACAILMLSALAAVEGFTVRPAVSCKLFSRLKRDAPQRSLQATHSRIYSFLAVHNTRVTSRLTAVITEAVNGTNEMVNGEKAPALNIRLNVNEKARTVTSVCTSGTLCTLSGSEGIEGSPFGSYVDYVLDDNGFPVLLMNEMSMHTMNIYNNPDNFVTLFMQSSGLGQDVSRCSLTGTSGKDSK